MVKARVRKGMQVTVIAGEHKGKSGEVLSIDKSRNRVTVEGVNIRMKAMRRTQSNPQGGISEIEGSMHASNVMPSEEYEERMARKNKSNSDVQEEDDNG
ncbi:MAG: 50S ribosomal protein L24 [Lentisphaeria bacterium]